MENYLAFFNEIQIFELKIYSFYLIYLIFLFIDIHTVKFINLKIMIFNYKYCYFNFCNICIF